MKDKLSTYAVGQGLLAVKVEAIPKRYGVDGWKITGWNDRDQAYDVVLFAPSLDMWKLKKWKMVVGKAINAYRRQLKAEFVAGGSTMTEINQLLKGYPLRGRLACLKASIYTRHVYKELFDLPMWEIE